MMVRQRDSIAKYLYDLSKIVLTFAVIANLASGNRFEVWLLEWGLFSGVAIFVGAYLMDGLVEGDKP